MRSRVDGVGGCFVVLLVTAVQNGSVEREVHVEGIDVLSCGRR